MRAEPPCCNITSTLRARAPDRPRPRRGGVPAGPWGLLQDVAAYRFASRSRHVPPLASMLDAREPGPPQVQRHLAGVTVCRPRHAAAARRRPCGSPSARPGGARSRSRSSRRGQLPEPLLGQLLGPGPGVDQRPGHPVLAGQRGLAEERRTQVVQLRPPPRPGNARDEPGLGRHALVDLLGDVVVFQRRCPRASPPAPPTPRRSASATMSKEKFGAQKKVGSRSRTVATPSADTVHDLTNSSDR